MTQRNYAISRNLEWKHTMFESVFPQACWSVAFDSSGAAALGVPAAWVRTQHPETMSSIHTGLKVPEKWGKIDEFSKNYSEPDQTCEWKDLKQ